MSLLWLKVKISSKGFVKNDTFSFSMHSYHTPFVYEYRGSQDFIKLGSKQLFLNRRIMNYEQPNFPKDIKSQLFSIFSEFFTKFFYSVEYGILEILPANFKEIINSWIMNYGYRLFVHCICNWNYIKRGSNLGFKTYKISPICLIWVSRED